MTIKRNSKKGVKKKDGYYGIYFLISVILVYVILYFSKPEKIQESLKMSGELLIQILPALLLVIVFMGFMNYFLNPKKVKKYVGKESGARGWLLAIFTGVLSHGPIYIWYPLLKDLREQGMSNGLIAVFLYNRAIKIPLLPLMIYYFGINFVVLLLICMIIASMVEGKIIDMMNI